MPTKSWGLRCGQSSQGDLICVRLVRRRGLPRSLRGMFWKKDGVRWLIAGVVALVAAAPCLVLGLLGPSLLLVYVSVALSLVWIPLLTVGVMRVTRTPLPAAGGAASP